MDIKMFNDYGKDRLQLMIRWKGGEDTSYFTKRPARNPEEFSTTVYIVKVGEEQQQV